MSLLMPLTPRCDFYCFEVIFEIGNMNPTTLFFFKIVSATLCPLSFHMNFRIILSISANKPGGILIETALNL